MKIKKLQGNICLVVRSSFGKFHVLNFAVILCENCVLRKNKLSLSVYVLCKLIFAGYEIQDCGKLNCQGIFPGLFKIDFFICMNAHLNQVTISEKEHLVA